jgi:hypothetical protein
LSDGLISKVYLYGDGKGGDNKGWFLKILVANWEYIASWQCSTVWPSFIPV